MDFATTYWVQVVKDYLSACGDFDSDNFTEDYIKSVAFRLLNDDDMWGYIDSAVHEHLANAREVTQ